ncbi:uncharacterized protein LOC119670101 [Teleopsis dalmanni]|uniref:uncharacterized protein LOC119670101 n=1 Tax=Teleopsis dalmanni TaxID=139649 RepID=UPI0018CCFF9C|nr:uncharacterized protein LOC119670101 [Teleopsis dalmanni]
MLSIKIRKSYNQHFLLLKLLLLMICITAAITRNVNATNATLIAAEKRHYIGNSNSNRNSNITVLHEVSSIDDSRKPIELNTHEVWPTKPTKKKPYSFDKAIITEYEKQRPLKPYELHPVTFDFNLGDLEDLEHESIKKGDLSSEEKHLLRDGNDEGLTYTERAFVEDSEIGVGVDDVDSITVITTESTATLKATTTKLSTTATTTATTTTTTTATETSSTTNANTPLAAVTTVSPHIFKILKNKSTKKGRELMKKDDLQKGLGSNFNSISRYFGTSNEANTNATAESLHAVNVFQILTNLYDQFYWQISEIRTKVSTGCGLEMQAYLTALQGNYEWAQKAYDASGRYRGQILFGNDKWLGQKTFCYELNRQLQPEERKHFEFEFYAAVIAIRLWLPEKMNISLQIGECLPKSCTSQDVHAILSLDPHAQMLDTLSTIHSSNSTLVQIRRVRTVPGFFSYWRELKFQIFASFMLTLTFIVLAATWYQASLNQNKIVSQISAISAKIDASMTGHKSNDSYNGKAFELYQMKTLNENNNVVSIEADVNGNKELTQQTNGSSNSAASSCQQKRPLNEADKSPMTDYKIETGSSIGATGTFEAKQQLGLHEQLLLCFAFQTNANTILNIDEHKENPTSCVHGLRVFSVLWTIMVHTYLQMFSIGENRFQRIIVERSVWYQFVGNATFSVDTFFFISGFLVTLLYLKQGKKYPEDTGQFVRRSFSDTALILIYRYIRLTPAYLFVIFFNDFALRQSSDASVFQPTVAPDTCAQYWWRNILYINNFYPLSEICMIWSWYMANDMQFYIMAMLLLVLSTRYFKTAVIIIGTFLLSSWAVSGVISLNYHYTHKVANPFESFDFLYDKPWQRVGTYIIGMIAGYIVFKVKTPPKISARTNLILWMSSLGLLALIIFGVWQGELNEINTAFYVSIGHTAFGLGLVWILLSCCWGFTPTINRILSYRGLWPLSRLTYCTYLIHPVIMLITSYHMSGTVHLNNFFVLIIFLGNAVFSFGVAFFISVLFEAPVVRLLKICFRK